MPAALEKNPHISSAYIRYECPHCGSSIWTMLLGLTGARSDAQQSWWAAACTNPKCQLPSLVHVTHRPGAKWDQMKPEEFANLPVQIVPAARPTYQGAGVPDFVANDVTEALRADAAGLYVAATVVGRRALQAAVRNRLGALKITPRDDKLFTEIDALPDEELPKRWKQAAHEVRHLGNDGAHAEPVSPEEAVAVLKFTKGVLEQLYVLPAQLAESMAGRAAKKAGQ